MSQSDGRIADLVAEFQRMTEEAWKNGEIPTTAFCVHYVTRECQTTLTWGVPPFPKSGGGSGKDGNP